MGHDLEQVSWLGNLHQKGRSHGLQPSGLFPNRRRCCLAAHPHMRARPRTPPPLGEDLLPTDRTRPYNTSDQGWAPQDSWSCCQQAGPADFFWFLFFNFLRSFGFAAKVRRRCRAPCCTPPSLPTVIIPEAGAFVTNNELVLTRHRHQSPFSHQGRGHAW